MTLQEKINNIINEADVIGKSYSSCSTASNIGSKIISALNKDYGYTGYDTRFSYKVDSRSGRCEIFFQDHEATGYVAGFTVHKAKGHKHHGYFSSYCDWTVKSVDVDVYTLDLAKTITITNANHIKAVEAKNNKLDRATDAYKLLMKTYGLSSYELYDLIKDLRDNYYTIQNRVEK